MRTDQPAHVTAVHPQGRLHPRTEPESHPTSRRPRAPQAAGDQTHILSLSHGILAPFPTGLKEKETTQCWQFHTHACALTDEHVWGEM